MKIREDYAESLSSSLFRLEFHEEKQQWHFENYKSKREENTFGWYTILSCASQLEIEPFLTFIESHDKAHLSIEFILKKRSQWISFYYLLTKYSWGIIPLERKIK